jgi:hypothetical protein
MEHLVKWERYGHNHDTRRRAGLSIYQAHNLGLWSEQQEPGIAVNDMSGYSWFHGSSMPMSCWTTIGNQARNE